jgi:ABC-2 type transport system ATP-binding protein
MIEIRNVSLRLDGKSILNNISLTLEPGKIYGLVGSNGSGKTTTIRALLGIYEPTGGELLIDGEPYSVSSGVKLGYLPEERGLYKKESVIDVMTYFGQLKGMTRTDAREKSLSFLQRVKLADKANVRIDKLSGGQQQKIQLGITVIDDPELLILDEPLQGLDPLNRQLIRRFVDVLISEGETQLLFVSHHAEDAPACITHRLEFVPDGEGYRYLLSNVD